MKIDSHHHFWKYDPAEYSWMNDDMGVLKKDHLPADLKQEIEQAVESDRLQVDESLVQKDVAITNLRAGLQL